MKKESKFLEVIEHNKIIPVFNHDDPEVSWNVLKTCYESGIRAFEFTNRSPSASAIFEYLTSRRHEVPNLLLGVGSIMDIETLKKYQQMNADFYVSPIVDDSIGHYCQVNNLDWVPGCGTLTEIITAKKLGATLIKIFPADVLSPRFVKGVLGPCPELKLMPTGGILPTAKNLNKWFDAGVTCVGMGSQLITKDLIKEKNYTQLKLNLIEVLERL